MKMQPRMKQPEGETLGARALRGITSMLGMDGPKAPAPDGGEGARVLDRIKAQNPQYDEDAAPSPEHTKAVSDAIRAAITSTRYRPKGTFALSTLKDNPVASKLLDFVAGPESNGNYNAVWGKANNSEDLSQYTVQEILDRQTRTVQRGGQSATGRYQFIKRTLLGLVNELDIPRSAKFTPELQDQLGLALLERRGLSKFQRGEITAEQFGNNLALEWASLPNLRTQKAGDRVNPRGVSAYAGDGLNKSHVKPEEVEALLGDLAGKTTKTPRKPRSNA